MEAMEKGIFQIKTRKAVAQPVSRYQQIKNILTNRPAIPPEPVEPKKLGLPEAEIIFDRLPEENKADPGKHVPIAIVATAEFFGAINKVAIEAAAKEMEMEKAIETTQQNSLAAIGELEDEISRLRQEISKREEQKTSVLITSKSEIKKSTTHAGKARTIADFFSF